MKRRILVCICLAVLMLIMGLTGCGASTEEESVTIMRAAPPVFQDDVLQIGLIQTGKESDWRDANTNDYLKTFSKENGYNLIYVDGNSDAERQIKAMNDLIAQKVDYIILQPIVETGWEDSLKKAKEAGIPVIVADRMVSEELSDYVISWVGSDFQMEGSKAMHWLESYLKKQGRENDEQNIVLLEGTEGATATIGRSEGIREVIAKHSNWKIIKSEYANFTQGEAQNVMEDILKKYNASDIDVIISENDNMMFGAMKAMDRQKVSYGPDGRIITISFDALGEAFEKMMDGKLHATIECNPLLAGNVESVIKNLEAGLAVEKKYYTEEGVFDYTNAADYADQRVY